MLAQLDDNLTFLLRSLISNSLPASPHTINENVACGNAQSAFT